MDLVGLIVAALTAGSRLGQKDASSAAAHDAAARLWTLARKRLASYPDGVTVLTRHAEAPRVWAGPLGAALAGTGAAADDELVAAAAAVLRLASQPGLGSALDLRGATSRGSR